ncbi:tail fiber protein [Paenibacillus sp. FSL R5-0407]|uniref:tail fiber protein n=1 Tax=Paenibacillus sp. FSL R5-0407 TaxID=2975320 RepID=UPI0030F83F55
MILVSSWSYALTNKGRQLQAKAQAGTQLVYTKMAVGSGTLSGQSIEAMTALITPVKNLVIERIRRPPGTTRALIGATLTNQDITTGFFLREVGIFAMDPDDGEILYMYSNSGSTADYIAPKGDGVIEKAVNMNVIVGTAANITVGIDESLVYATRKELEEAIAGITIGDASTTQKGVVQLSNAVNSTSEALAATPKAVKTVNEAAMAAQTTANAANQAAAAAQTRADEAFQSGNERKAEVVAALIAIGVPASTSESWAQLIPKMASIIRATGDATAADLLAGKKASNAGGSFTGTMIDRGAAIITPSGTGAVTIPDGAYKGAKVAQVSVPAAKVLNDTTIAGVAGTMANQGAQAITPGTANKSILAGYHNGNGYVAGDLDLIPNNIKNGVNIFGVVGTFNGAIAPGDAVFYADDVSASTSSTTYVALKNVKLTGFAQGSVRVSFRLIPSGGPVYAIVYINGIVIGTLRSISSGATVFVEDFSVNNNDVISIYGSGSSSYGSTCIVSEFRVGVAVPITGTKQ